MRNKLMWDISVNRKVVILLAITTSFIVAFFPIGVAYASGDVTFNGPADGVITQTFSSSHDGTDIAVGERGVEGDPIYSASGGTVEYAGWENPNDHLQGFGVYIKIRDEKGNTYWYGHLKEGSLKVKKGDTVTAKQQIAEEGSTGHSTGPHLHFRIHNSSGQKCDPYPGLKKGDAVEKFKVYTATPTTSKDGGFYVSIDKLSLLAPYVGLASTILITTITVAIYVKHINRIEEEENEKECA